MRRQRPTSEAKQRYQADVALAARRAGLLDDARKAENRLRKAQARRDPVAEIRRLAEDLDAALTDAMQAAYAAQRAEIGVRGYDDRIYRRKAKAKPSVHALTAEAEHLLTLRETHRLNGIPAVEFKPGPLKNPVRYRQTPKPETPTPAAAPVGGTSGEPPMLKNQVILLLLRALVGIAGVVGGWLTYPTGRIVSSERAVPTALIVVGAIFVGQALLDRGWKWLYYRDTADAARDIADAQAAVTDFEEARTALDQAWQQLSGPTAAAGRAGEAVARPSADEFSAALKTLNLKWAEVSRLKVPSSALGDVKAGGEGRGATIGVFVAAIATVLGLLAVFGTESTSAIRLGALVLVIGAIVGLTVLLYASDTVGDRTGSLIAWIMSILFGATAFGLACIGFAVFFR